MRLNRLFSIGCIVVAAACASSATRPPNVNQADVDIRPAGSLFFGSGTTAPLNLDVTVTNRASVPIKVRSIRISSPGMVQYAIRPTEKIVSTTLAPGQSRTFAVNTTAVAGSSRLSPTEPLSLRADIDFEADGRSYREIFNFPRISM